MARTENTKILEHGYFHISNSGLSFETTEHEVTYTDYQGKPHDSLHYRLKVSLSSFGANNDFSFPLGSEQMVQYLIESLTRVRQRMLEKGFKSDFAFEANHPPIRVAEVVNGLFKEEVKETKGTETRTIAFNWLDEDKNVVRTEYLSLEDQENVGIYGSSDEGIE